MTWTYYPDSPYGAIDICEHGCVREHDSKQKECLLCDYSEAYVKQLKMLPCSKCCPNGGLTYHYHGKCLVCTKNRLKQIKVDFT